MRVKICGITNLNDALNAIDAGANALGFVFYTKSKRYIDPTKAKEIIEKLPPFIQTVGLFVNDVAPKIDFICSMCKIDLAQIHFDVKDDFFDNLRTKSIRVIRAKCQEDVQKYNNEYRLIDAFVEQYGGEGKRLNLQWFDNIDCSKIIIAGGINQSNINDFKKYNFYALDLSSGVEEEKGIKSKKKLNLFMNTVNELYK